MMRLAPGSVPWLLRHELRLVLRMSAKGLWRPIAILGVMLVGVAAIAGAPLAAALAHRHLAASPAAALATDLMLAILFCLMLSQALSMIVLAFYQRGDLELLLSSPLPPRRVLFVRCAAIALGAVGLYLALATALLAPLVVRGRWPLLATYPLLLALGLAATGAGLLLAAALFRAIGPRRTRTVGQVLAAFCGAFVILAFQVPQFLPHHHAILAQWFSAALHRGWFAPSSVLSWPLRAACGASGPFLALAGASAAVFVGAVEVAGGRFAAQVSAAAGIGPRRRRGRQVRPFRTGLHSVLIHKELRLIARDPMLLSRVLLPVLYLIPALLVSFGHGASANSRMAASAGAALLTVIAGQIAGSLAWITISAEDAPDLLRCAPVARSVTLRAKLTAAALPLAVLVIPVGALAWLHPRAAAAAMICIAASVLSNALIQLWYQKPMPRSAFRRLPSGSLLPNLGGLLVSVGWGAVAALAAEATPVALTIAMGLALLSGALLLLLWLGVNREERPIYARRVDDVRVAPP